MYEALLMLVKGKRDTRSGFFRSFPKFKHIKNVVIFGFSELIANPLATPKMLTSGATCYSHPPVLGYATNYGIYNYFFLIRMAIII